jgi:hypothetical protein
MLNYIIPGGIMIEETKVKEVLFQVEKRIELEWRSKGWKVNAIQNRNQIR